MHHMTYKDVSQLFLHRKSSSVNFNWITFSSHEFHLLLPFQSKHNSFLFSATVVGCAVIFMILVSFIIFHLYKKKYASSNFFARNTYSDPSSRSEVEGGSVYFGVPVYSYSELEEATNYFDIEKELRNGGFGTVYHGKMINTLLPFQDHLNYNINFLSKMVMKKVL